VLRECGVHGYLKKPLLWGHADLSQSLSSRHAVKASLAAWSRLAVSPGFGVKQIRLPGKSRDLNGNAPRSAALLLSFG
jgi:hypothetical protein